MNLAVEMFLLGHCFNYWTEVKLNIHEGFLLILQRSLCVHIITEGTQCFLCSLCCLLTNVQFVQTAVCPVRLDFQNVCRENLLHITFIHKDVFMKEGLRGLFLFSVRFV